jgi:mRNA-degrading endonuclease RelE of RelBE toxin-antitoxin system
MTKIEIQSEIQKTLSNIPENILKDILDLLKSLEKDPNSTLQITHSLRQIISEDKELLEMLAK